MRKQTPFNNLQCDCQMDILIIFHHGSIVRTGQREKNVLHAMIDFDRPELRQYLDLGHV